MGWGLSLANNLINKHLPTPAKHLRLGVVSTTSALWNSDTEMNNMINVPFSDQRLSDNDKVTKLKTDSNVDSAGLKLAKTRSGKRTEPHSSPLLPSSPLPLSSPLLPLSPLTPLSSPIPRIDLRHYNSSDNSSADISISAPVRMSSKSTAEVTHAGSNKPPILSAGTVSLEVLRQFENACHSFFHNKEGLEPKDFVAHIAGGLHES